MENDLVSEKHTALKEASTNKNRNLSNRNLRKHANARKELDKHINLNK